MNCTDEVLGQRNGDQWVSIGDFALRANASVSLTNITANGDYASDLAYSAIAFIPRGGRLVQHTIDAFSMIGQNQSMSGSPDAWIEGDFASDNSLIQMADNLSSGLLAYPACATHTTTANCIPQPVLNAMNTWRQAVAASNGHRRGAVARRRVAPVLRSADLGRVSLR